MSARFIDRICLLRGIFTHFCVSGGSGTMTTENVKPTLLSVLQISEMTNVHISTVWRWMTKGVRGQILQKTYVGGRVYITDRDWECFTSKIQEKTSERPTHQSPNFINPPVSLCAEPQLSTVVRKRPSRTSHERGHSGDQ